ncbi:MAG TPA: hypothetical protein V6C72_10760 [Chroococcales cyanobacterium]
MKTEAHLDEDLKGALAALRRAAKRARELAQQTGTAIVVIRDGKLVREFPQKKDRGDSAARTA